jgi:hypothetical protein
MSEFSGLEQSELLQVFNDQLNDLLNQLNVIINALMSNGVIDRRSKSNLEFYRNLVAQALSFSKEVVIESFGAYILKSPDFIDKIIAKDESYFENYDFMDGETDKNLSELVKIIKDVMRFLEQDNKDIIFEYLKILCDVTVVFASKKYA